MKNKLYLLLIVLLSWIHAHGINFTITGFGNNSNDTGNKLIAYNDCSYPAGSSSVITVTGFGLENITAIQLNQNSNQLGIITPISSNLLEFTIPNYSNLSGSRLTGKINFIDNSSNIFNSIEILTVLGCALSNPKTRITESELNGEIGSFFYLIGTDLQDFTNFKYENATNTLTGKVSYSNSFNQLQIPIPATLSPETYNLEVKDKYGYSFFYNNVNISSSPSFPIINSISPKTITGGGSLSIVGNNFLSNINFIYDGFDYNYIYNIVDNNNIILNYNNFYSTTNFNSPILINDNIISVDFVTIIPNALPTITGFANPNPYLDDYLTILGNNLAAFGNNPTISWKLKFPQSNNIYSTTNDGVTDNYIIIKLGNDFLAGSGLVTILGTNNDFLGTIPPTLTIKDLDFSITGVNPSTARVGEIVSIKGSNFVDGIGFSYSVGSPYYDNLSQYNTFIGSNLYLMRVPRTTDGNKINITATKANYNSPIFNQGLTVRAPTITGFANKFVPRGGSLTILGNNFLSADKFYLQFNNFNGTNIYLDEPENFKIIDNQTIVVPELKTQYLNFSISDTVSVSLSSSSSGFLYSSSTSNLTITSPPVPTITDIQPRKAYPYEKITITGQNLNFTDDIFISNSIINNFSFSFISPTKLVFAFDNSTSKSMMPITVSNVSGSVASAFNFTVSGPADPIVTSINPLTSYPKEIVTIRGKNFEELGGITSLEFDGIKYYNSNQRYLILNDSIITFIVPPFYDESKGSTITSNFVLYKDQNVVITASPAFSQVLPVISITSFLPTSGPPRTYITFTGTNLKYIENMGFDSKSGVGGSPSFDINKNSTFVNNQLIVQINDDYSNSFLLGNSKNSPILYSPYLYPTTINGVTPNQFTLLPFPIPTITGVISPTKIYPNSIHTVVGKNLYPLSTMSFTLDGINYTRSVNNLSDTQFTFFYPIELFSNKSQTIFSTFQPIVGSFSPEYVTTIPGITVQPFDGSITILGISKKNLVSSDILIVTINSSGNFYPDYNATIEFSNPNGLFDPQGFSYYDAISFSPNQLGSGIHVLESYILGGPDLSGYQYDLTTSNNYSIRARYILNSAQTEGLAAYSNIISGITFTAQPVFAFDYPFDPPFGNPGEVIELIGYDFEKVPLTGVFFNTSIPSSFSLSTISGIKLVATIPSGNTKGKIRLTFAGGQIVSNGEFNFLDLPFCNNSSLIFSPLDKLSYSPGETINLIYQFQGLPETDIINSLELSSSFGDFTNAILLDTNYLVADNRKNLNAFSQVSLDFYSRTLTGTIPLNTAISDSYYLRLKSQNIAENKNCINLPYFNINVTGNTTPISSVSISSTNNFLISAINPTLGLIADYLPNSLIGVSFNWELVDSNNVIQKNNLLLDQPSLFLSGLNNGVASVRVTVFNEVSTVTSAFVQVTVTGIIPNNTLTAINIISMNNIYEINGSADFVNLIATDQNNVILNNVIWSVVDPNILFVSPISPDTAVVFGLKNGATQIKANILGSTITGMVNFKVSGIDTSFNDIFIFPVDTNKFTINGPNDKVLLYAAQIDPNFGFFTLSGANWIVENPNIATVISNPNDPIVTVIGFSNGLTFVTAQVDTLVSQVFPISVSGFDIVPPFESFNISLIDSAEATINTYRGELWLKADFVPDTVSTDLRALSWSVSDTNLVQLDSIAQDTVVLTALKDGIVTVTAVSMIDPNKFSTLVVTITNQNLIVFNIEVVPSDTISEAIIEEMGGSLQLEALYTPFDIEDKYKGVSWKVSDTGLATIDGVSGLLTALRNGTVIVTATSTYNKSISGFLEVELINQYVPVLGMKMYSEDSTNLLPLAVGDIAMLADFIPEDATDQRFRIQLIESIPNLVVVSDTIDNIVSINDSFRENGVVTVIGTSIDNPSITSIWVLTTIGQLKDRFASVEVKSTDPQKPNVLNLCNNSVELFLPENTETTYLGYEWYYVNGNDTSQIVGADKPTFKPVIPGTYFVYAYDDEFNYEYIGYTLTTTSPTKPEIVNSGIVDEEIKFDTLLSTKSQFASYQWYLDGKLIKGETNTELRVYYNGSYTLIVKNESGCDAVSDPYVINRPDFVDIARGNVYATDSTIEKYGKPINENNILVYPNPNNGNFEFEYFSTSKRFIKITIYNSEGNTVYSQSVNDNRNATRKLKINAEHLQSGIYNIQVNDGGVISNKRIFIQ